MHTQMDNWQSRARTDLICQGFNQVRSDLSPRLGHSRGFQGSPVFGQAELDHVSLSLPPFAIHRASPAVHSFPKTHHSSFQFSLQVRKGSFKRRSSASRSCLLPDLLLRDTRASRRISCSVLQGGLPSAIIDLIQECPHQRHGSLRRDHFFFRSSRLQRQIALCQSLPEEI
eukprot:scaffold7059_cov250-Pinguiococcus_pyrenoidosus.AAC.4